MRVIIGTLVVVGLILFFLMKRDSLDVHTSVGETATKLELDIDEYSTSPFVIGLQDISIQHERCKQIIQEMHKQIVGLDTFIMSLLTSLLVPNGHVLVEGVPGLAKTKTIAVLSQILDLAFKRIQFTPDMLPGDLTGVDVFDSIKKKFSFVEGPLFAQMILADEINRTTPKVQSALLEAMEEQQITLGHTSYPLPSPFFVMATQNPLEQEGTYPLPEAQVDRFFMKIHLAYPSAHEEKDMLELLEKKTVDVKTILHADDLLSFQEEVQQVTLGNDIKGYIVRCIAATRDTGYFQYGASPRASIALMHGAKALAWLQGRNYVMHSDVQALCLPVLRHRVGLSYTHIAKGLAVDTMLVHILQQVSLIENV